ncbi:MAG: sugar ABC transporter ATP-binding protein [Acidobacteria bacterium]|nr:MAG: sugar ABC transporter ATP-binding protein [Acidobacteriota bacterium]
MAEASIPLLDVRGVSKRFPGVQALDDVRFELRQGEVHVLLGENGAGKSTLMKILSGACARDAGIVRIDGRACALSSPREAQQAGISTIYQEFNLVSHLTAADNIFLGREARRMPGIVNRRTQRRDARHLLGALGSSIDPDARVADLTVAEQQMVEVAKALSLDAKILIMDEPTSALTESEIEQLFAAIRRLTARGGGVIYISHRLEELSRIGDRATVLRDGRYVATLPLPAPIPDLVRLMANRDIAQHYPPRTRTRGEMILEVRDVARGTRLRGVSFTLHRGEILGVAGLLGAGRTELARVIGGADRAERGQLLLGGRPLAVRAPSDAIHAGIGLVPEDRKRHGFVAACSVAANVALPQLVRLSRAGVVDRARERALATRWIEHLRIKTPGPSTSVSALSGGNQQKVVLAKWLALGAGVLIVDEPTRGIDVAARMEIYQLLDRLAVDGAGILMISSDLPEVLGMSDRILVMHQGRVAAEFDHREATHEGVLHAALGLAS